MYGVVSPTSTGAPDPRASHTTVSISCWARSGPSSRSTASSASSHSCVSWGSASLAITAMSVVLEILGVVVADVRQIRQHHAQVMAERLLGGVRLAAADCVDHGLVLVDHLGDVAWLSQAQTAHTVEVPVRASHNRPRDRPAAELAQRVVKFVVEREEGVGVVVRGLLARDQRVQFGHVARVGALRSEANSRALERFAQELRVVHAGHADAAHERAELRDNLDQLVVAQPGHGFAYRGAAHAQELGQLVLGDLAAGLKLGADDRVTQAVVDRRACTGARSARDWP